jgi:predicted dithiol-disulfide oxidoreductase (DUF899 family)
MTQHATGTRQEWLAARLDLLEADKELTRRSDELAALHAVSRAPLAKLQAYRQRMGWTFPWASSFGSEFNADFSVFFTPKQQVEEGIEYNYRREAPLPPAPKEGAAGVQCALGRNEKGIWWRRHDEYGK